MGKPTGFKEYPRKSIPYRDAKLRMLIMMRFTQHLQIET